MRSPLAICVGALLVILPILSGAQPLHAQIWAGSPNGPFALPTPFCPTPISCVINIPIGQVIFQDRANNVASQLDNMTLNIQQTQDKKTGAIYDISITTYDLYNKTEDTNTGGYTKDNVYINLFDAKGKRLTQLDLPVPRSHCREVGHYSPTASFSDIIRQVRTFSFSQSSLTASIGGC
jgi:hypothetical protein